MRFEYSKLYGRTVVRIHRQDRFDVVLKAAIMNNAYTVLHGSLFFLVRRSPDIKDEKPVTREELKDLFRRKK